MIEWKGIFKWLPACEESGIADFYTSCLIKAWIIIYAKTTCSLLFLLEQFEVCIHIKKHRSQKQQEWHSAASTS